MIDIKYKINKRHWKRQSANGQFVLP